MSPGRRILEFRFRNLHVPVAKIVPEESVQRLHRRAELELVKATVDFAFGGEQAIEDRVIVGVELRRFDSCQDCGYGRIVAGLAAHLAESTGVPQLVAEVFSALDPILLE